MEAIQPQDLLDPIPLPAFLVQRDGRIGAANEAATGVLGTGLAGRPYITVLRQPGLASVIETALGQGTRAEGTYTQSTASGEALYRVTAAPIGAGAQAGFLVCLEDISPLQAAGQMRRDFVANVSHELRTPLTAVIGYIETLKGAARNDPDAQARFLDRMGKEAVRMNRLVSDLLSLSRVEAVERQRPGEAVPLIPVLRASIASLAGSARDASVTVELVGEPGEIVLPGDEDQLRQVINNLLENAIKYGAEGGIVWIRVHPPARDALLRSEAVRVTVEDRGPGIDPIHLPRITERFYRVDDHRSREMGGTGLGLAIVKHIVNRHRGRLDIDSAPGQGTRVSLVLPVL